MNRWLLCGLLWCAAPTWAGWFDFYDWSQTDYSVATVIGRGTVSLDDQSTDSAMVYGADLAAIFPYWRNYRVTTDLEWLTAAWQSSEGHPGLDMNRFMVSASLARRWPLNRDITLWFGGGLGAGAARYSDRHTVNGAGFLERRWDDETRFSSVLNVRMDAEYRLSRNTSITLGPRYEYPIGVRPFHLAGPVGGEVVSPGEMARSLGWAVSALILLASQIVAHAEAADPLVRQQYRHYGLSEFTALKLSLVADQATRLVFPFKLNQEDVPLGFVVSPSEVFAAELDSSSPNILILKNVMSPKEVQARIDATVIYHALQGQFFLTVDGYHLSIELTTSLRPTDQVANVVFEVSGEDRDYLIDRGVERKTAELKASVQAEREKLKTIAQQLAELELARALQADPERQWLRFDVESDNGDLVYYAEQTEKFVDQYVALRFSLVNRGPAPLFIDAIDHFAIDGR